MVSRSIGSRTRVKVVKNKVAPPFRQAEFDIMYGKGISREGSLLDIGVDLGIVKKSGAWYTYEGEQLGQGRENAKQFLAENPELMVEISERVQDQVGIGQPVAGGPAVSPRRASPWPTTSPSHSTDRGPAPRSAVSAAHPEAVAHGLTGVERSALPDRSVRRSSATVDGNVKVSTRHIRARWRERSRELLDARTLRSSTVVRAPGR